MKMKTKTVKKDKEKEKKKLAPNVHVTRGRNNVDGDIIENDTKR